MSAECALKSIRDSSTSTSFGDLIDSPSLVVQDMIQKFLPAQCTAFIHDIHDLYEFNETTDQLGTGAQAIVYKAKDRATNEEVAIKAVIMHRLNTRKRWTRLAREIDVLFTMRHPNILALKAVLFTDTNVFIVCELLKGGELFNYILKRGYVPEPEARHMLHQLVSAVNFLHLHKVTHRDLKPENIMLVESTDDHDSSAFLTLKIVDFGYSKRMTRAALLHSAVGSPMYAAPEVFRNLPYGLDVDMFSIGVITYILLCGFPPFDAESDAKMVEAAAHFSPERAFDWDEWDDISPEAKDIIIRCLQPGSSPRITAAEFLQHPWITGRAAPTLTTKGESARYERLNDSPQSFRSSFLALPVLGALREIERKQFSDEKILRSQVSDDEFPSSSDENDSDEGDGFALSASI